MQILLQNRNSSLQNILIKHFVIWKNIRGKDLVQQNFANSAVLHFP